MSAKDLRLAAISVNKKKSRLVMNDRHVRILKNPASLQETRTFYERINDCRPVFYGLELSNASFL